MAKFGHCQLDCNSGHLIVEGTHKNMEPLVFQFVLLLIQHQGEVVSKSTVIKNLWPDRSPTDEALRAMVKKAREALKDDARNPSYIKTIPTKGYLLIPNVELSSTILQTWFVKNRKLVLLSGLLVTLACILAYWYIAAKKEEALALNKVRVTKTLISNLDDNIVSAYYINGVLKNIVKERNDEGIFDSLSIEDVNSKETLDLAFSGIEIQDFWWSRYSNRLLVTRNDNQGLYLIQFSPLNVKLSVAPKITLYDWSIPDGFAVAALNYAGTRVLLFKEVGFGLSWLTLEDGKIEPVSSVLDIKNTLTINNTEVVLNDELSNIAEFEEDQDVDSTNSPEEPDTNLSKNNNLANTQLIGAWPSPINSHYIVVLQNTSTAILLLLDSDANDIIIDSQKITRGLRHGVWNTQGDKFSFNDQQGALFSYQATQQKVTSWNTGGELVNGLIADCGESCFVVANTLGLPKIATLQNPFEPTRLYAQAISSNKKTRSESQAFFTQNGIYFIAQSDVSNKLIYRAQNGTESIIYDFGEQNTISEFSISDSQELMIGMLNSRPFTLNLIDQNLKYLNITYPEASRFMFVDEAKVSFYAKPPNQPAGLYIYDLNTNQITLASRDVLLEYAVTVELSGENQTNKLRARLSISDKGFARLIFRGNREAVELGDLGMPCVSCVQIHGNFLYYLDTRNKPILNKIDMASGEKSAITLGLSDVSEQFSLSPNGDVLAFTVRQNLQTNLLKVQGFTQVY